MLERGHCGVSNSHRVENSLVTVFFGAADVDQSAARQKKIDRSMSIVAEAKQIPNRRNSLLKSRAQISDGSERRFFLVRGKSLR